MVRRVRELRPISAFPHGHGAVHIESGIHSFGNGVLRVLCTGGDIVGCSVIASFVWSSAHEHEVVRNKKHTNNIASSWEGGSCFVIHPDSYARSRLPAVRGRRKSARRRREVRMDGGILRRVLVLSNHQRPRRMRKRSSTAARVSGNTAPKRRVRRSLERERTSSHLMKLSSRRPPSGGTQAT